MQCNAIFMGFRNMYIYIHMITCDKIIIIKIGIMSIKFGIVFSSLWI